MTGPLAVLTFTRRGQATASRLLQAAEGELYFRPPEPAALVGRLLARAREKHYRALVFVAAAGIAVRLVGPHLTRKQEDPAVVVVDDAGRFVIPLVGAHRAGANELASHLAAALSAQPVITTAAEARGLMPLERLALEQGWRLDSDGPEVARVTGALLDGEPVAFVSDAGARLPETLRRRVTPVADPGGLNARLFAGAIVVTDRRDLPPGSPPCVVLRPPTLAAGIGCERGVGVEAIEAAVDSALAAHGLSPASLFAAASIDRKRDEPALAAFARRRGLALHFYSPAELDGVAVPHPSPAVRDRVGTGSVAEAAAVLASGGGTLVVPKVRAGRVTVAVARRPPPAGRAGRLDVVGIGPGAPAHLTRRAEQVLQDADVIVGYRPYVERVREWLPGACCLAFDIGEEVQRVRTALALARRGLHVALISGGDPGIFGMAGLVFEVMEADASGAGQAPTDCRMTGTPTARSAGWGGDIPIEVVPGVTAASAAAALLGAPLMQDFAVISLSDRLVPWPVIEARLEAAAAGGLVVALYNPASSRRADAVRRARSILLRHRPPDTPVGVVRNAMRAQASVRLTTLGRLCEEPVDMTTTIIVGSSATRAGRGRMWTARGYRLSGPPLHPAGDGASTTVPASAPSPGGQAPAAQRPGPDGAQGKEPEP